MRFRLTAPTGQVLDEGEGRAELAGGALVVSPALGQPLRIRPADITEVSEPEPFVVRLRLADKKDGLDVVPVFWDDNYFSMLPGEDRIVSVTYDASELHGSHPEIQISGFNIVAGEVPLQSAAAR